MVSLEQDLLVTEPPVFLGASRAEKVSRAENRCATSSA